MIPDMQGSFMEPVKKEKGGSVNRAAAFRQTLAKRRKKNHKVSKVGGTPHKLPDAIPTPPASC